MSTAWTTVKNVANWIFWIFVILMMATCSYVLSTDEYMCDEARDDVAKYERCRNDPDCNLSWRDMEAQRHAETRVRRYCHE